MNLCNEILVFMFQHNCQSRTELIISNGHGKKISFSVAFLIPKYLTGGLFYRYLIYLLYIDLLMVANFLTIEIDFLCQLMFGQLIMMDLLNFVGAREIVQLQRREIRKKMQNFTKLFKKLQYFMKLIEI